MGLYESWLSGGNTATFNGKDPTAFYSRIQISSLQVHSKKRENRSLTRFWELKKQTEMIICKFRRAGGTQLNIVDTIRKRKKCCSRNTP